MAKLDLIVKAQTKNAEAVLESLISKYDGRNIMLLGLKGDQGLGIFLADLSITEDTVINEQSMLTLPVSRELEAGDLILGTENFGMAKVTSVDTSSDDALISVAFLGTLQGGGANDYNGLENIPVINQDLSASDFTPVANTYYRHTGAIGTYTQGVIYYYDGTEYKEVNGSGGGISDVQVNGTSVVADGVANIPIASVDKEGVVKGFYKYGDSKIQSVIYCGRKTGKDPYILPSKWNSGFALSSKITEGIENDYDFGILINRDYGNIIYSSYQYLPLHFYVSSQNTGTVYGVPHLAIFKNAIRNYINHETFSTATFPDYTGTMMVAPSSWSSGTSGSLTLSASGLYEIKASVGSGVFSTIVNWDGSSICYSSSLGIQDTDAQALTLWHYEVGSTGILSLYKVDSTGSSNIDTTANISYRKIGIA